jgi:hypothetical protein
LKKIAFRDFSGAEIAKVDLPEIPNEVMLSQAIDFLKAMEKIEGILKKDHENADPTGYVYQHILALGEFFRLPPETFDDLDLHLGADELMEIDKDVSKLISYLFNVIQYQPKLRDQSNFRFSYRGQVFEIPYYRASAYLAKKFGRPDLKVGEYVEAVNIQNIKTALLSDDPNGSELYTKYVVTVAILARKPGELLPEGPAALKRFIEDRTEFFQDIDLVTAYDIGFFLRNTLLKYRQTRHTPTSSIHQVRTFPRKKNTKQSRKPKGPIK